MLVKDEADIIEYTVRHLAKQVDAIIVSDNLSADGTTDILEGLVAEGLPITVIEDPDPAHYQSRKTTAMAVTAVQEGHEWVLPCDADEYWYQPQGIRIGDWLAGLEPQYDVVTAALYDHKPTAIDPDSPNPFARIGWRMRDRSPLSKVAVKMRAGVVIQDGNHGVVFPAWYKPGHAKDGLVVRHFSWRSEAQFIHKRRIGHKALGLTTLPKIIGEHWRSFGPDVPDETIGNHFREWFYSYDPGNDPSMIYDPIERS